MVGFLNHLVAFSLWEICLDVLLQIWKRMFKHALLHFKTSSLVKLTEQQQQQKIKYYFIYVSPIFQVWPATNHWLVKLLSKMSANANMS